MLKIGIVGCGKIADQHVDAIHRIPDCELSLFAIENSHGEAVGERFGISACFSELSEMLEAARLDVVHITTPPQSHYSLAKQCLESGSHVYLEKPFTITAVEAESLIRVAERRNLKITAGHNLQFTPETLEMRQLLAEGLLGGKPVHLESHFSYDLGDTTYVSARLGNR
jgi:predicted dehydrogenase